MRWQIVFEDRKIIVNANKHEPMMPHPMRQCAGYQQMPLLQLLAVVVVISLALFFGHELLDAWISKTTPAFQRLLHLIGHVFSSLVVAAVVFGLIIRNKRALVPISSLSPESPAGLSEAQRRKVYAEWFVAMRWVAVWLTSLLVFVSVQIFDWLPQEVWWPLMITVAVLAASNVFYTTLLQRDWRVPLVLHAQGYVDLVIMMVLLHFSGGIMNPLSWMMIFHIVIGGIVLPRGQAYAIAAAAAMSFGTLAWSEWARVVEPVTLTLFHFKRAAGYVSPSVHGEFVLCHVAVRTTVFFLLAYFVTTLAERIRGQERQIEWATLAERIRGQERQLEVATAGRQLLEQALQSAGVGFRILTQQLQTEWANLKWTDWFFCRPGETCQALEQLNGEDSPAARSLMDKQAHELELVVRCENCPTQRKDGNHRNQTFHLVAAPLLDGKGSVKQVVELCRDITHEKQAQEQMIRAGKFAAVGELAGQVAHEVNNPIAIISAKTRLLLSDHREGMSPKVAQELGKITESADRVARIAQGLLSYCRPSAGTRMRLDARVPIRKSLAMIEQRARSKEVKIEDDLPAVLPEVQANAGEIEQIFLNLFLNALDAMPGGGLLKISSRIEGVSLADGTKALALTVQDTGSGIPEDIRARIFEPFFTTKEEGHGTGLGLSICLGLVRSHGGEIEVESEAGRGTRFIIKLPIEPAERTGGQHG